MLFNSFEFLLFFLPLVWGIARILRKNVLLFWLSFSSFVFYAFAGHWWFLVPMAISTTLDYWTGFRIQNATDRVWKRRYLCISLVANLGLLFYFKYSKLAFSAAQGIGELFGFQLSGAAGGVLANVVLPAGISFYTFQTISYVVDIYRGESRAETNFLKYVSFVAFFPHLVAGPLTRHNQLIPQLTIISQNGIRPRWREGIYLFAFGLAKKVLVADRIANLIDPVIAEIHHAGFVASWVAVVGYAMQIYFDFSGYSDMAIGLGRLFDIELPQNFNSPYQARNPSDFWKRWHITLSQWLRDYLYIPLGGNRGSARNTERNLMLTMVLGGLWHGASWTFAAWGFFHGMLLVLYRRYRSEWDVTPVWFQRGGMFFCVCIGWVFFRSNDFGMASDWLVGLMGLRGAGPARLSHVGAAYILFATLFAMLARNLYSEDLESLGLVRQILLGFAAALSLVLMNYSSKFLYFQF